jgi:hypothetical protein
MSALPALPRIDITNTVGSSLVGALISAILYGLTSLQTYLYFLYYPKDTFGTKALVTTIWVLDTVHTAFMSICVYHYLVSNYFNPIALASGHWSLFVSVALNVVVACIVQTFFVIRIFRLCGPKSRWIVTAILSLTVLAHFAFGIETVVYLFIKKFLVKLPEISLIAATPFAIFAVLSDILIAGSLCYLLHGSRTGFKRTDTMVSTLIIYAINRCLLTSVVAVVEVIVFSALPHSLWYLAIDFVIGKLYANSLLATLNCRVAIRNAKGSTFNSVHLSGLEFNSNSSRRSESKADARVPADVLDLSAANISRHTHTTEESENSTALDVFSRNKKTSEEIVAYV